MRNILKFVLLDNVSQRAPSIGADRLSVRSVYLLDASADEMDTAARGFTATGFLLPGGTSLLSFKRANLKRPESGFISSEAAISRGFWGRRRSGAPPRNGRGSASGDFVLRWQGERNGGSDGRSGKDLTPRRQAPQSRSNIPW